ncbi:MAG TPA: DivIVA domain-containing protein [Candidatus Kapabacteria bacterium]|jgi:cell division initiation protein
MPERLSALDIKKKDFPQKMRGPDPDEVRMFLELASTEVELLTLEKKEIEQRFADATLRLDYYVSMEQTIEKTLAAAQQTVVKMEEQAKKEAELILREAEMQRQQKLVDARVELDRIESQLIRARCEYQSMISRMRSAMAGFETFMQSMQQESETASTNDSQFPSNIG